MAQRTVYSIGELTAYIKALFEEDALLGDVWLQGEVSNFKLHTSGHCYLTLKDPASSIKAVIWRTTAARLTLPRDGDAVIAHGRISVYEPQGAYQLYIDHIEPAGVGRLWLEFERLKQRLEAEGLFDAERKRPIPAVPVRLGIVTSATGAALRDILQTLRARYRAVEVVLAPTLVQGDGAPASIIAALQLLNRWSQSVSRWTRLSSRAAVVPSKSYGPSTMKAWHAPSSHRACPSSPASATRRTSPSQTSPPTCARPPRPARRPWPRPTRGR